MGAFPLLGLDRVAWSEEHEEDLVAVRERRSPDHFSRSFTDVLVPKFHKAFGERLKVRTPHSTTTNHNMGLNPDR